MYECPHCHKRTEVYSRITGYYRPVQNWNDGKTQEWKDRKTYDPMHSTLKHSGPIEEAAPTTATEQTNNADVQECKVFKPLLFVQAKCPNCKMAELMLDKNGFEYTAIDATENVDMAKKLGIKMTPTMAVEVDGEVKLIENAVNIRKYIEQK